MTLRLHGDIADAYLQAIADLSDDGTGNAVVEIWSGNPPATLGGTPVGDKLAELTCSDPVWGAIADHAMAADEITADVGLADGEIGFVRLVNADDEVVLDEDDVGTSNATVIVTSASIVTGAPVTITSWTMAAPLTSED